MDTSKITNMRDSNQITRAYLDSLLVESRYLDSCVPDLHIQLYGHTFSSPIMTAAFSHLMAKCGQGTPEMARGALKADICNWTGMGTAEQLDEIIATGAKTIKIVKPYEDRERVYNMIRHAEEAGAIAVGMDIDHSFDSKGNPDFVKGEQMQPVTKEELRSFIETTKLPFIVKGVLSVQDAVKCVEAGAKGLMLSHHHSIMPCAVPPLMALPRIKAAVGTGIDLFVDCGIATGEDVFKCLALGAKGVSVGRAVLPSFQQKGADGVAEYVAQMNDELRAIMAKTASVNVDRIPMDVLWDSVTAKPLRV